ncbi:MAG: DUF177 domain-containing protein [Novosphingobium sp.]|nr:DUF177 domain-containing protein [Novosphingobium sp.]MCP5379631.1 DUF177 domain-containing protein [Novosphingobium sp.]
MNAPEFSRLLDLARPGTPSRQLEANAQERAALARRFGLVSIERLVAGLELDIDGGVVSASGHLSAAFTQSCAVSGEDMPIVAEEELALRFVPQGSYAPDEEVELSGDDCDEIEYAGGVIDLGEAVAQSLALAIDPFATGPDAERVRKEVGLDEPERENPFAVLKGLKPQEG